MPNLSMSVSVGFDEYISQFNQGARMRLVAYKGRTLAGDLVDLRSQLFRGADRDVIAKLMDGGGLESGIPVIDDFEVSERARWGSYSQQAKWEDRRKDLFPYFSPTHMHYDRRSFELAVHHVSSLIPPQSLQPLTLEQAVDSIPKGKSTGLPIFSSNKGALAPYIERVRSFTPESVIYPAVAGWRGQPTGPNQLSKQRMVWMYDKYDTIEGSKYLYPILNVLRKVKHFAAWVHLDEVDVVMTSAIKLAKQCDVVLNSSDFTAYDSSVSAEFIDVVRDIVISWFVPGYEERLVHIFHAFKTVGMLTPDGLYEGRNGGVPSGSIFTNLVDSIVNLIACYYVAFRNGVKLVFATVLGDDAVTVYDPQLSSAEITKSVLELGLVMSSEKQFVSLDGAHYLQRLHTADWVVNGLNVGVRPINRSMNGMLSYERRRNPKDWSRYLAAARTIMQIENSKWHPMFKEWITFLTRGEEMLLELDPVEIFSRAGGSKKVGEILGIDSFRYTSRDPEGIAGFQTTAVLRELKR